MEYDALPSLYRSADKLSLDAQNAFFRTLRWHLVFLVTAAALSVLNIPHWLGALTQVIALVGALGTSLYLMIMRPERTWYGARAVAESVKTLTWRFVSRAEPFNDTDEEARTRFAAKLREVTSQNEEVASRLTIEGVARNITPEMLEIRSLSLNERSTRYTVARIEDQLAWYSVKARRAERDAKRFFGAVVTLNILALLFAILRIRFPETPYWPTDVFVTLSASVLSWIQARRFSELSASYNLAAHEIALIRDGATAPSNEDSFSRFVSDTENAFSREHTQWVARKDR